MIRVMLVGVGGYGQSLTHGLLAAAEKGLGRLVAAADTRLAALPAETANLKRHGVRLYGDAIEMFDDVAGNCEAAYIASGIGSHCALACAAARRGFHIHLEKPPAPTVQEVDEIARAVADAGVLCIVGFQMTWGRDMRFLKDRIAAGRLGRIRTAAGCSGSPRDQAYYTRNEWAGRLKPGGKWVLDGPAMNAQAHQITNLLLLASADPNGYASPVAVRSELYAAGPVESHNIAAIEIRTDGGAMLYYLGSHATDGQVGPFIDVHGDAGEATWSPREGVVVRYADGSTESCGPDAAGRQTVVDSFLQAIDSGDASLLRCTLPDARNMVLTLNGAHESSGRVHRVADGFVRRVDEGTDKARTVVEGLDQMLIRAASERALFSDLSDAPDWTVATEPYDLTGYGSFPQRFRCD